MLSKVEATNRRGNVLELILNDVSDGLALEEVEGLDPVKATLVSSSFAGIDGAQHHFSRREPRNLKMKLGLEPDFVNTTVKDLRDELYDYFMPKSEVSLRLFDTSGLEVTIDGIVEEFDSPLFTREPTADISLMCFDPDFVGPAVTPIAGSTVSTTALMDLVYEGTVETGFVFTLNVNRSLSTFTIYHTAPDGTVYSMPFNSSLVAGDVLKISTVAGDKGAWLTRAGVTTSLLYAVSYISKWFELEKGTNKIRVHASGNPIPYTIEYTTKYGGL